MASEYNLKIKAQLDTTQIRSQLAALNTQGMGGSTMGFGGQGIGGINFNGIQTSLNTFQRQIDKLTMTLSRVNTQSVSGQGYGTQGWSNSVQARRLWRIGAGYVGGEMLGYASEQLNTFGYKKLANIAGMGSYALKGAASGAMVGSVIPGIGTTGGAAIGAIVGSIKYEFDKLGDAAKELEKAFQESAKSFIQTSKQIDQLQHRQDIKRMVAKEDIGALQDLYSENTQRILNYNKLIDEYKPIAEKTQQEGLSDEEKKEAIEAQQKLARAVENVQKLTSENESIEKTILDLKEKKAAIEQKEIDEQEKLYQQRKKERELENERIRKEVERNEMLVQELKEQDKKDVEQKEIQTAIDAGDINDVLAKWQKTRDQLQTKYDTALSKNQGDIAAEYRDQLSYAKRNVGMLEDAQALLSKSKDKNKVDFTEYDALVDNLQKQLTPVQAVSDMATIGGSMGWVDENVNEQINNNVQNITRQLDRILDKIASQGTGIILN